MAHTIKQILIKNIFLAPSNPRHEPIEDEKEIMKHLLLNEQVRPLARSISKIGGTSPLERIAVVEHPTKNNKYIAMEGNRRTCALKLLSNPNLAPSDKDKSLFRSLSEKMENKPRKIEAVVFETPEEARIWMSLRHEGEQGGVGTKNWNATQKARFNSQDSQGKKNPNVQASALIDYARDNNLVSQSILEKLKITTITRYLTNPVFRHTLGLTDAQTLSIDVSVEEFNSAVSHFLTDAALQRNNVSSRSNAKSRMAYAKYLQDEGIAPKVRGEIINLEENYTPPPEADKDIKAGNSEKENSKNTPAKNNGNSKNPNDRKYVIPREFSIKITDKTLKRLYDELRKIDPEVFTFAAIYLLRAVIEQAAVRLLRKNGIAPPGELHNVLGKLERLLIEKGVDQKNLKNLRVMANDKESRLSPETIGHFVHGGAIPTKTDVIKTWDSIEFFLTETINRLD